MNKKLQISLLIGATTSVGLAQTTGGTPVPWSGWSPVSSAGPFTLTVPAASCAKNGSSTFIIEATDYDLFQKYDTETGSTTQASWANCVVRNLGGLGVGGVALPTGVNVNYDATLQDDFLKYRTRWKITCTNAAAGSFDMIWRAIDDTTFSVLVDSDQTATQTITINP